MELAAQAMPIFRHLLVSWQRTRRLGPRFGQPRARRNAPAIPPAAQMLTRPRRAGRRAISYARVVRMRPPVAAHGCPTATELPLTFTLSHATGPVAGAFQPFS